VGLEEVSSILWRERNLLDLLHFKLEEERLVAAAGLSPWLPQAAREVEIVLAELRQIEGPRSGALDAAAAELGLQPGRALGEVAAAAPPPWAGLLEQHRQAIRAATSAIGPLERLHRDLLGRATEAVLAWLAAADGAVPDDPAGQPAGARGPTLHVLPSEG
jgi:hypothetical protein